MQYTISVLRYTSLSDKLSTRVPKIVCVKNGSYVVLHVYISRACLCIMLPGQSVLITVTPYDQSIFCCDLLLKLVYGQNVFITREVYF